MDAWRDIRLKARECHREALAESKGDRRATVIISAALKVNDLQLRRYEAGTVVGEGVFGFLDRDGMIVNVLKGQDAEDEALVVGHEIGHYKLHLDPRSEVTTLDTGLGGDPIDSGAGRVEGYSPRERKEVQADVFAGEFLCPSDWLRGELIHRGRRPSEIADELGLHPHVVMNQAVRALLLPPLRPPAPADLGQPNKLDESQHEVATWNQGPLLVDAGPGTGKTRTLVHRVRHLLENGASPASILALTFSNKAAEEMRERLSAYDPAAAIEMWAGTFHAFGLELIVKCSELVGRSMNVKILDQAGSLAMLENNLTRLPLRHYQNLYEPAYELVHVLRAISRCKDELITPAMYHAEAEAALAGAASEEAREVAEKALEVAGIYAFYEEALREADAVDFGDLVMLSAGLLEQHDHLRAEYQRNFEHVLVDEYQDVNHASARLLRALSSPGADIWVVGDQRQSIYRFRGAAPTNVQQFETDFSGARRSLKVNYRSGAPVVGAFQAFSGNMRAASGGGSWSAHRGNLGGIAHVVAPSVAAEAAAIRDHIEEARAKGIPYSDQAIIARTHLTLSRITGPLEKLGVPLLYLGDVFERDEIRDLLSLVSIDAEAGGIGLVRVAQLDEYRVTRQDALGVIAWARDNDVPVFEALRRIDEIEGLSDAGGKGLALLGAHLEGMGPATSAWTLLTTWLFERSAYLTPLIAANDAKSQQKLIAIYQLLKVCGEFDETGTAGRKQFLARIRRIEALNDDRMYRAVASEASDTDAVRVLTVHGSKGLEFGAVHLPALATRYMPATRQGNRCPPPPALAHLTVRADDHDAEEECLFFVALSRARDFLFLSRAERYTTQRSSPSKFLSALGALAPPVQRSDVPGSVVNGHPLNPPQLRKRYEERELDLYLQCPARYRYETIDGLRGARDDSPYIKFHRCVYRTVAWLEQQRSKGVPATLAAALGQLGAEWSVRGPVGHGFEAYYRASAERMVTAMVDVIAGETGTYDLGEWVVELKGKEIALTPDRVVIDTGGAVHVQRLRTGRRTLSETEKRIYALLRRGAALRYPGRPVLIETYYLASAETVVVPAGKDSKHLEEYSQAIAGIEHGAFAPTPQDVRRCPSCQCYFICGK